MKLPVNLNEHSKNSIMILSGCGLKKKPIALNLTQPESDASDSNEMLIELKMNVARFS